jgi:tetratricopeptide (TPR) repeat protein
MSSLGGCGNIGNNILRTMLETATEFQKAQASRRAGLTRICAKSYHARLPSQGCDPMPTIDKRYLARLLLIVILIVGAFFGIHELQAERIPAALRRQADRDIAANKPDAAIRHLRQCLEFEPDNVDVQEQLAELLRPRPGTHNELHFLYDRILRGDPNRNGVRREALALALRTGRFTDAVTHASI